MRLLVPEYILGSHPDVIIDHFVRGRLTVCSSEGIYGMVCGDSWGDSEAAVACRQMGFSQYGKNIKFFSLFSRV